MEKYTTGTGQKILVHKRMPTCDLGCVIHNPTDRTGFPTRWREDRGLMERICPCGVGHPDVDAIALVRRLRGEGKAEEFSIHGCCGCCSVDK